MTRRTFIPGSPWLYFKLYTGHKTADELLTTVLGPLARNLQKRGVTDRWFFIRYTDPEFHLRFRLHMPDPAHYGEAMTAFHRTVQPCVEDGRVTKVLCDTYVRELERYGTAAIELLEELFCIDSAAQLELLARLAVQPAAGRETLRQHLSLLLLDDTLTAFGCGLPDKLRVTGRMAESFRREFGFTTHAYTRQLNDKYRAARNDIERVVTGREECAAFADVLDERRRLIAQLARRIAAVSSSDAADSASHVPTDDLLPSIQHMIMNRWFRSRNRQYELVIYDFLSRYYTSVQARNQPEANCEAPENRKKSREN